MRILVADDEALVRYGLISILEDILPEPHSIIEAANGLELKEQARNSRPHIGFVDIHMPKLDGLEAISQAKEYAPQTLWVVLSGHADFTYAQKALKLGVEDFLLKPADPDEVKKLMSKLREKARMRQRRGNRELEAKVAAVLGNLSSPQYDPWFAKPRFWQAGMVLWDSRLPQDEVARRRRAFAARVMESMDSGDDYSGCTVSMPGGTLLVVLAMPAGGMPMDKVIDLWNRRFTSLRTKVEDLIGEDICDTWLLTRVLQDSDELFREIKALSRDAVLRYVHRPRTIMNYAEFAVHPALSRCLPVADTMEKIRETLDFGEEDDFHGFIHELKELVDHLNDDGFVDGGPALYTRYVLPFIKPTSGDLDSIIRQLREEGHSLFTVARKSRKQENDTGSLPKRATEVMERRYRESIGIAQVAEELEVTPNYLSTVFKQETGMSFTQYLTELRLDKSRELLLRQDANVGEVARSLGYQSSRHFTRLFKERFTLTPSQWVSDRSK